MKNGLTILCLIFVCGADANADLWKWVDANGDTHFVDTLRPIYTWVDESGKVYYGDTPAHEDAVSVELVWVSSQTLLAKNDATEPGAADGNEAPDDALPGAADEQRAPRTEDDQYYCERATEALESYLNAPQLYRTGADGQREILSKEDAASTIAETRRKKAEYCL
jgi:hypothetical protein